MFRVHLQDMSSTPTTESPSRVDVWKMFDRIAHRYDLLNRSLSFGRDTAWRKRMRRHLPVGRPLRVVDLATGTADQILFLLNGKAEIAEAKGYDLSEEMLEVGRKKIRERDLTDRVELLTGDAMASPAPDASADAVTISFGIRNVLDVPTALRDMKRILVPGGRVLILECSVPANPVIRWGYLLYFRHILPWLGGLVSGDRKAYQYLNQTVETFPCGEDFCALMRDAGFEDVKAEALTFGVATLYIGTRPEGEG
jgi:demethylmenaquinone methyltransferase/2-methoxy-6-polyprenyl-1,4-benzoquinol methylase